MSTPGDLNYGRMLSLSEMAEQVRAGEAPHAVLYASIPHGKSRRLVEIPLDMVECLTLAANALEAARLLAGVKP